MEEHGLMRMMYSRIRVQREQGLKSRRAKESRLKGKQVV
jgi:hypothetical protein